MIWVYGLWLAGWPAATIALVVWNTSLKKKSSMMEAEVVSKDDELKSITEKLMEILESNERDFDKLSEAMNALRLLLRTRL